MMNARYSIPLFCFPVLLVLLIAACGGGGGERPDEVEAPPATAAANPTGEAIARQTMTAIAVNQTVAALTAAGIPTAVSVPEEPSPGPTDDTTEDIVAVAIDTPEPTSASITQPPTEPVRSCTVVSGVNLRSGPGTAYHPPIGSVATGTMLRPLAFSPFGYPQGAWLQVEVLGSGQVAWLSAGSQYVSCTIDLATLPSPSSIPATPPPVATDPPPPPATPQTVAATLPNLNVISSGIISTCENNEFINSDFDEGPSHLLRIFAQLAVQSNDERCINQSGDGACIDRVEFSVSGSTGQQVYSHTENRPGYCIFQNGEPNCNNWPRDAAGRITWGNGGPVVAADRYLIIANVVPKDTSFSACIWQIDMLISP